MRSAYGHIAAVHGHPMEATKLSKGLDLPVAHQEDDHVASHRLAWSRAQLVVIGAACSLLVLASMGLLWRTKGSVLTQRFVHNGRHRMNFASTAVLLPIRATNSYTEETDDIPGSAYPYTADYVLVEPYVDTLLAVKDADAGFTYTWSFEDGSSASGSAVTHCFETVGTTAFTLRVHKEDGTGEEALISSGQYQVLSRYVRRELRSLSEQDLSDYLAAANEVYTLKPSGGRRIYGSAFTSIQEIAAIYNQLASDVECNHLADGMGFMTSHAGLLLTFERSIQAINPALAVPYWDFTIDAEEAKASGDLSSFYDTPVFGDDMFGQPSDWTAAEVEDMSLSDGTFAGLKVRRNVWDYGLSHCPYGYSRSPLNVNPSSTVTRHARTYGVATTPPDCADHYAVLQSTSLRALHAELQTRALDPLLTAVGGVANADMTFLQTQYDYGYVSSFAQGASKAQWALYRRGLLSNHEYCLSPSTTASQQGALICRPTCSGLNFDTLTAEDASAILQEVHPLFAGGDQYRYNGRGEDVGVELLQALCNGFEGLQPMFGDLTDVPVNDPLFWSSLSTIERLWQWKRINGIEDMSWPSDDSACYGHGESDIVTGVFKLDSSSNSTEYLSNAQLLELTDPTVLVHDMTYLYDSFEWSHCAGTTTSGDLGTSYSTKTEKGV